MNQTSRIGSTIACTGLWLGIVCNAPAAASESPALSAHEPLAAAVLVQRGRAASVAGREAEAQTIFKRLAREYPEMSDYSALWLAESFLRQGNLAVATEILARGRSEQARSRLVLDFAIREGEARAALADEAGAREAWRAAAALLPPRAPERAPLWLSVAESFDRERQHEAARRAYVDLWSTYPLEPESQAATRWLEIDRAGGGPPPSARDWHRRGNRLYRLRGADDQAHAAYAEALKGAPSKAEAAQIRQARAELFFRQRKYEEAAVAFSALPQRARTPVSRARSIARAGRVEEAIDDLVELGRRKPARRSSYEAKYIAALLMLGEDREEEARELFAQVGAKAGALRFKRGALWQLAWSDYRAGRYGDAIAGFEKLSLSQAFPIDALRPRYWKARALHRLDDPSAAHAFEAIAAEFPLSYYGWQAAQRLTEMGRSVPPAPPRVPPARTESLEERDFERVRILIEGGLTAEAKKELEFVSGRARHPGDWLRVAALFQVLGEPHRTQRESMRIGAEELARGPARHSEEFWWHAWPRAFGPEVRAAAQEHHGAVDSDLILAIIREESGYRPDAISAVGARGLMQLMEPTAREMAEQRGRTNFSPPELFEPDANIQLATEYLAKLSDKFPGRPASVIASYNAGPHVVARWSREKLDADEWIETIPFAQTQKYVKRVLRTQHVYDSLYSDG